MNWQLGLVLVLTLSPFQQPTRDVARVPRRERGMNAYEVMLSESQERMLVVVEQGAEAQAHTICARWGLHSAVIGEVTDTGRVEIFDGARQVVDVPTRIFTDECPVYYRQGRPAPELAALQHPDWAAILPAERPDADLGAALLMLLAAPNIASKARVYRPTTTPSAPTLSWRRGRPTPPCFVSRAPAKAGPDHRLQRPLLLA